MTVVRVAHRSSAIKHQFNFAAIPAIARANNGLIRHTPFDRIIKSALSTRQRSDIFSRFRHTSKKNKKRTCLKEQIGYVEKTGNIASPPAKMPEGIDPVSKRISASWKEPPWTRPRRSTPLCHRSSAPSAKARSCGSARTRRRSRSRRFRRARSASTSRWASAACRAAASIEIYGPESSGKTTLDPACHRRGAEERRHLRLRRRRTCARSGLRPQARRQSRRSSDLAARHRRAGARDHRHAGALRRGRRAGHRFGRRPDAPRRNRRRDGRRAAGPAGPPDEPGAAQAHRLDLAIQHAWSSSSTRSA